MTEHYLATPISQFVVIALSAVDHGFESLLDQTKDHKIGICCFSEHAALRGKSVCSESVCVESGATCLPADVVAVN